MATTILDPNERPGKEFIFSNGFKVWLRPVAGDIEFDIKRNFPEPTPPYEEVETPQGKNLVPRFADPDYIKALAKWESEFTDRVARYMFIFCVGFEFTEQMREQVQQLRNELKGEMELDPSDKFVYVTKFLATISDYQRLEEEIRNLNSIPEKEVEDKIESFRHNDKQPANIKALPKVRKT